MLSSRTKIILIIILFISLFLIYTDRTDADLVAERTVKNNKFTATTLSFSQRHTANNSHILMLFRTMGIQPDGFDVGAVRIKKDGKLNFKYHMKTVKVNGDDGFCQALNIQVMQKGVFKYQGKLVDLSLDSNVDNSNPQNWIFFISLDDDSTSLQNKNCEFNFDFKTWRNTPDQNLGGFYAQRLLHNNISSGNW